MGDLLKDALAVLDGKGGGGPDFAQGSGAPAKLDDALSRAAHKLTHP
jgi:alanyl-tRNA synthetase